MILILLQKRCAAASGGQVSTQRSCGWQLNRSTPGVAIAGWPAGATEMGSVSTRWDTHPAFHPCCYHHGAWPWPLPRGSCSLCPAGFCLPHIRSGVHASRPAAARWVRSKCMHDICMEGACLCVCGRHGRHSPARLALMLNLISLQAVQQLPPSGRPTRCWTGKATSACSVRFASDAFQRPGHGMRHSIHGMAWHGMLPKLAHTSSLHVHWLQD